MSWYFQGDFFFLFSIKYFNFGMVASTKKPEFLTQTIPISRVHPRELWQSHASLQKETASPLSPSLLPQNPTKPQQLRLPSACWEFSFKWLPLATLDHSAEWSRTNGLGTAGSLENKHMFKSFDGFVAAVKKRKLERHQSETESVINIFKTQNIIGIDN